MFGFGGFETGDITIPRSIRSDGITLCIQSVLIDLTSALNTNKEYFEKE